MTASHDTLTRAELGCALDASTAEVDELRRAKDALARAEQQVQDLNAVLRAVRNVNQLITREKDPYRLLSGSCRHLADTRGYIAAWAVAWDTTNRPISAAQAGLEINDSDLLELYRNGLPSDCRLEDSQTGSALHIIHDPAACSSCPLGAGLPPRVVLSSPLAHESRVTGKLSVAVPITHRLESDEKDLLIEVAGDLGFALHAIELEVAAREAVARVHDSEQRYRELFDAMSSGVAVYRAIDGGKDFVFVDFNRAGERIEQVDREALIGRRLTEVFPGVRAFGIFEVLQRVYWTGTPEHFPAAEYRDNRIQGWRDNYIYRLPSGEVVAVYDDVTKTRQAEQRLRDTMTLYRTLVRTSPDATIMTDLDGFLTFVSPQAADLFGYDTRDLMAGQPAARLVHPRERAAGIEAFNRVIDRGVLRDFPLLCIRRDGTTFHGELSASLIRHEDGTARAVISVVRDITERHRAEEAIQRLNQELEARVQRRTVELQTANAELESFAYSVSHDLRTPLRTINFFCHIAKEDHGAKLPLEVVEYFDRIADATRQMERLIKALLDLAQVTRAELVKEEVNLSELAADIVARLRLDQADRDVVVDIQPGLVARGDRDLLRQLLQNLLGNAWKFTSGVPVAEIRVGRVDIDGVSAFHVSDNGAGFNMAHARRLFQPFQRLHDEAAYPGTGIGLATVKRVVTRHGGRIWARAEEGKGATFYFTLEDGSE